MVLDSWAEVARKLETKGGDYSCQPSSMIPKLPGRISILPPITSNLISIETVRCDLSLSRLSLVHHYMSLFEKGPNTHAISSHLCFQIGKSVPVFTLYSGTNTHRMDLFLVIKARLQ